MRAALLAAAAAAGGGGARAAPVIAEYDLSYTNALPRQDAFDHTHTVACLCGLANRDGPAVFTPLLVKGGQVDSGSDADQVWKAHITQQGGWLNASTWQAVASLEALVARFRGSFGGVVLYDPAVPATSNLASTAAGVEGLLPVSYRPNASGSVYQRLVAGGPQLPVALNLVGMFAGGAPTPKIAAYRWARARWLAPGVTHPANPAKLAYYVDYWAGLHGDALHATPGLSLASNHDYFVAHRAYFFDLAVWADEPPVDDPTQPLGSDRGELMAMLDAAYRRTRDPGYSGEAMIHMGGFTPWWYKYTKDGPGCPKCKHGGVETEWETMQFTSAYNVFDDGDACCVGSMANAAFYQHHPLPERFVQNAVPTVQDLQARGLLGADGRPLPLAYAAYYAGDYDSAAWLYNQLRDKWDDPRRGEVPIGWAIDSELSMRFPVIYPYLYQTRTANDWFVSGDSGAGYLNPSRLFPGANGRRGESNVTEAGDAAWKAWCTRWYNQFNLSFTGFLINGDAGAFTDESLRLYESFSPGGVVITTGVDPTGARKHQGAAWLTAGGMPVMHHVTDLPAATKDAAEVVKNIVRGDAAMRASGKPTFYVLRNILKTASYMADVAQQAKGLDSSIRFVDPYSLGLLAKLAAS